MPWAEQGALKVFYPYVETDSTEISEEDELEAIAMIESIRARDERLKEHGTAGTAEYPDHGLE